MVKQERAMRQGVRLQMSAEIFWLAQPGTGNSAPCPSRGFSYMGRRYKCYSLYFHYHRVWLWKESWRDCQNQLIHS